MKSRFLECVGLGVVAATANRRAGFWIARVSDLASRTILCRIAGGGGFGRAGRTRCTVRGSTGLAEVATAAGGAAVAGGCGLAGCGLVVRATGARGITATGAGSGAIFAGALTGGRSGPAPPAIAGPLPTARAPIAAVASTLTNDGCATPPASRSRGRSIVMSIAPGRANCVVVLADLQTIETPPHDVPTPGRAPEAAREAGSPRTRWPERVRRSSRGPLRSAACVAGRGPGLRSTARSGGRSPN